MQLDNAAEGKDYIWPGVMVRKVDAREVTLPTERWRGPGRNAVLGVNDLTLPSTTSTTWRIPASSHFVSRHSSGVRTSDYQ